MKGEAFCFHYMGLFCTLLFNSCHLDKYMLRLKKPQTLIIKLTIARSKINVRQRCVTEKFNDFASMTFSMQ